MVVLKAPVAALRDTPSGTVGNRPGSVYSVQRKLE